MSELRDYQQELLREAEAALEPPEARVMLQLPTGGGKTRIAAELLARWTGRGGKAAWLTHRAELSDQTCGVLNKAGVRATNTLTWNIDDPAPARNGGVVILMAQTVSRRNYFEGVWDEYGPEDLLIIDEAHHATAPGWERAICQWPGRVIGLTATPWRLEKDRGFNHLFGCLIPGPQIKDMQSKGHLAKAEVLRPDASELISGGEPAYDGDYRQKEIEKLNEDRYVWTAGAFEYWKKHAQDRQTIVYAVTRDHARNLSSVFNDASVHAAVILGGPPDKGGTPHETRTRLIKQFSEGKLQVLVNVAVATEGFDLPNASCVLIARPTLSLALYLQMVGRGLRPKSDGGDCLILDLGGNVERHGFPDDEHEWSLEPRGQQTEDGSPPIVRCPYCEHLSPASSHSCRFCEYEFGKDCERCGAWRAWERWSAETYCGDDHDLVCNRCHLDSHSRSDLPELPFDGGLREMLKGELAHMEEDVRASSLHTLTDVQVRLSEVAEQMVNAMKIDDMDTFERMTDRLRPLLRREKQLRNDEREQAVVNFMNELLQDEGTKDRLNDIRDMISKASGGKKRLARVNMKFGPKPVGDIYHELTKGYVSIEQVLEDVVSDEEEDS